MDLNPIVEINLTEYGDQNGAKLIMSEPTFRRMRDMKNALKRCLTNAKINGVPKLDDIEMGDIEIVAVMAYVQEAPFKPNIDSFLDYTDIIDGVKIGNGNALFERMKKEAEHLKSGGESPLPN